MATPEESLKKGDLIPDAALRDPGTDIDSLDHAPVARVVSDLARTVDTRSNIALFGPWGSGKSSIYSMMKKNIAAADSTIAVVDYDAWKFGGSSLHRNFLMHLSDRLNVSPDRYLSNLHNGSETTRLRLSRFLWTNKISLAVAFIVAAGAGVIWLLVSAWAAAHVGTPSFKDEVVRQTPSAAVVFGVVIAALLLSNQSLASAVEKRTRSPLQDSDQFSTAFDDLIKYVTRPKPRWRFWQKKVTKLIIFIDELDRCSPEDVVTTLIDLKTFLDHENCVFIVAADREVLERALEEAPQAKPVRESEPYYSTAGAFLDKIFQHQMSLPPMRPEALTNFAMSLADKQDGLWGSLRADRRRYEDVVYSLVPAHVQSPRRVKVLMNNFATNARVIEARQMAWEVRAVQIAVMTVLETEFPSVVKDFKRQPRLLEALVDSAVPRSAEIEQLVVRYDPSTKVSADVDEEESPAGALLTDDATLSTSINRARQKLNQQLDAYLTKVRGAEIPFPTPDLIYLQNAGHAQGLEDTDLATALDFAADTDPDQLLKTFHGATTTDRKAAVVFLSTQANTTFGSGRANILESACRIAETLHADDLAIVAGLAASTVLGEIPKGRWRKEATPGALLLGLFDPNIADPVAQLGEHAEPEQLAQDGVLNRVIPILPGLEPHRAEDVHALFGAAYANHPQPLHEALNQLATESADRLWTSQRDQIIATLDSLPDEKPTVALQVPATAAVTPATTSTTTVEAVEDAADEIETSDERYDALLDAVSTRDTPATNLGVEVLLLGLGKSDTELYWTARDHIEKMKNTIIDDATVFNNLVLQAIANAPTTALFDEDELDVDYWLSLSTPTLPSVKGRSRLTPPSTPSPTTSATSPPLAHTRCHHKSDRWSQQSVPKPPTHERRGSPQS